MPNSLKPEHMTELRTGQPVRKDHPLIRLRGKLDSLEASLLEAVWAARKAGREQAAADLAETLDCVRAVLRAEVLNRPLPPITLFGLDGDALRERSHHPQKYYSRPHFMPVRPEDGEWVLTCNRLRAQTRETEIAALEAFTVPGEVSPDRPDILQTLNRLSSAFYVMMFRAQTEDDGEGAE
jgi:ethanolamine utilization cobalamin adenosyltransferase